MRVTLKKKKKGLAFEKYVDCGQNRRNDDGTHCNIVYLWTGLCSRCTVSVNGPNILSLYYCMHALIWIAGIICTVVGDCSYSLLVQMVPKELLAAWRALSNPCSVHVYTRPDVYTRPAVDIYIYHIHNIILTVYTLCCTLTITVLADDVFQW